MQLYAIYGPDDGYYGHEIPPLTTNCTIYFF